jgi:hypothetical protein
MILKRLACVDWMREADSFVIGFELELLLLDMLTVI